LRWSTRRKFLITPSSSVPMLPPPPLAFSSQTLTQCAVSAVHLLQFWMRPLGICRMLKSDMLISPQKNVPHPAASTCCLEPPRLHTICFKKMCVFVRCFVQCYRARCLIQTLNLWSWQRHFLLLCTR